MRRWWGKVLSSRPTRNTVLKFFRFMAAGLPGLAVAVPLNLLLVEVVGLHKVLAYLLVLVVQISINFLACLVFVFERDRSKSLLSQYLGFTRVVGIARVLDWALYSALTSLAGLNFIFVQVMNAAIFGIGKFVLTRRVIEQTAGGDTFPEASFGQDTSGNPLRHRCNDVVTPPKLPTEDEESSLIRPKEQQES